MGKEELNYENKIYLEIDSYINGNISDFKRYINKCSKRKLLDIILFLGYRKHNDDTRKALLDIMRLM